MLKNLSLLKKDMEQHDWIVSSFLFHYNSIDYIVLVERFTSNELKSNKYASVKLHFIKSNDLSNEFTCEANQVKLLIDNKVKDMRIYFNIEYSDNLGSLISQFTEYFGRFIPINVTDNVSRKEKICMIKVLSNADKEDPEKIYCKNVMRNADGRKRTVFNANKARLLRNTLFEYFKNDNTISFCFSKNPEDENDDEKILKKFAINGGLKF
ncbi:DUF6037 family protein [Mycoplasma sp. BRA290]|uniref:DUF6037 family protein n=1 Tax=unclassified Mycoplasma TaxID=2683645 RepID=UPI003AABD670